MWNLLIWMIDKKPHTIKLVETIIIGSHVSQALLLLR